MTNISIKNWKIGSLYDLDNIMRMRASQTDRVEFTPLSDGSLRGDTILMQAKKAQLYFADYGNLSVNGIVSNTDMVLGAYLETDGSSTLLDETISKGDIGYFPPGFEHRATYQRNVSIGMLMIDPEYFGNLCESRHINFSENMFRSGFLRNKPKKWSDAICRQFQSLQKTFVADPTAFQGELEFAIAVENLIDTFYCSYNPSRDQIKQRILEFETHTKTIQLVENILRNDPENSHEIETISDALGLSRRTVYRAFIKQFGIPPNVYIRRWRLARAYMDLRKNKVDRVIDASQKWGFQSPSRFAQYYRNQFKELPSRTLQRELS